MDSFKSSVSSHHSLHSDIMTGWEKGVMWRFSGIEATHLRELVSGVRKGMTGWRRQRALFLALLGSALGDLVMDILGGWAS